MDISVIFATYWHENVLEKTLNGYLAVQTSLNWQLIIVDNAGREETKAIINNYQEKLPITFLTELAPGKNNAINRALSVAKGKLLLFTDNDIIPSADILDKYAELSRQYPKISIFTGKIHPDIALPTWLDTNNHRIRSALGIFDKGEQLITLPASDVWGGNLLMRKNLFDQDLQFNSQVGPNGQDYIMGSETELLNRLEKLGFHAIYQPDINVFHQIRSEQLSEKWLSKRAFRSGKGAHFNNADSSVTLFGIPRYYIKKLLIDFIALVKAWHKQKIRKINALMEFKFTLGKIVQAYKQRS